MPFNLVTQQPVSPNDFDQLTPILASSPVMNCSNPHSGQYSIPLFHWRHTRRTFPKHDVVLESHDSLFSLFSHVSNSLYREVNLLVHIILQPPITIHAPSLNDPTRDCC